MRLLKLLGALLLAPALVFAAPNGREPDPAQAIYDGAKEKVLKIRVVLNTTQSQASVGSGFVVNREGLVVTNYHVVSDYVIKPDQYSVEFTRHDGRQGRLRLLNVDVVHDLALLRMDVPAVPYFRLLERSMFKGQRGFSIGNPLDLGLTIVEGTYNGIIEDALYEHVHFTGAINPGMSGGPAITREGTVFGVNVSRMVGSQLVSFLVPVKFVRNLIASEEAAVAHDGEPVLERVRDQLLAAQDFTMQKLLAAALPLTRLGPYTVPDKAGAFMKCWGRSDDEKTRYYQINAQTCSAEDSIFVTGDMRTGYLEFDHTLLASRGLGVWRFYNLYEARFAMPPYSLSGTQEQFTEFRCQTDFVTPDAQTQRTVLCLRAYKKLTGLYDLWLRTATLDSGSQGLISTLYLAGVSYENGTRFARKYLDAIGRKP